MRDCRGNELKRGDLFVVVDTAQEYSRWMGRTATVGKMISYECDKCGDTPALLLGTERRGRGYVDMYACPCCVLKITPDDGVEDENAAPHKLVDRSTA